MPRAVIKNETNNDEEEEESSSERKLVETYLKVNDLEDVLNGVINELVTERPADPYLSLSSILVDFSRQSNKVMSVKAREVIGATSTSDAYLQVDVETTKGVFQACFGGYGYDDEEEGESKATNDSNANAGGGEEEVPRVRKRHGRGSYTRSINAIHALVEPRLKGTDPRDQAGVDKLLQDESGLNEIARLCVSLAMCRAGASQGNQEVHQYIAELANVYTPCIPAPIVPILEGGKNGSSIHHVVAQAVVILPSGATSFDEGVEWVGQVTNQVEYLLQVKKDVNYSRNGGMAPLTIKTMDEALSLVEEAIKNVSLTGKVLYGLDVQARDFAEIVKRGGEDEAIYNFSTWDPATNPPTLKKKDDLLDMYTELLSNHPLVHISEPFHPIQRGFYGKLGQNIDQLIQGAKGQGESALEMYKFHLEGIGGDQNCLIQLVGDLPLQNEVDIDEANTKKTINTFQMSLRKGGTVSGLIRLVQKAQAVGFGVIMSSNQGDAMDDFMAHAAVGLRAGQVNFGSLRSEIAKYGTLLRIERAGEGLPYAASNFRKFR